MLFRRISKQEQTYRNTPSLELSLLQFLEVNKMSKLIVGILLYISIVKIFDLENFCLQIMFNIQLLYIKYCPLLTNIFRTVYFS